MRPARARAPDDRDVPLPAQRAHVEVRAPTRRSRTSSTRREIWIVSNLNPDGAEYDIATGCYRSWRKNRQPNSGLERGRHRPQPQLGLPVGLLRRLERHVLVGDLPRRRRRSRRPRRSACATSSTAASSAACSRSRPHIDFHTYSELVLWPYGYTTANTAPGLTADDQAALSQLGRSMAGDQRLHARAGVSDLYIADGTIDDWAVGRSTRSSATRSRCTRARRARASIRPAR